MASRRWARLRVVVWMAVAAWCFGRAANASDISVNDSGDLLHATGCAATGTGTCTLRDAITFANSNPGPDRIGMTGVLVRPRSALPPITDSVTLNGTYYPTGAGPGVIDGTLAGPADGLVLAADQSSLFGLVVQGFEGTGIVVLGANNTVGSYSPPPCTGGCPIGVVTVSGNGGHGIEIRGGTSNKLAWVGAQLNGGNGIYIHAGATFSLVGRSWGVLRPGGAEHNRLAGVRIGEGVGDTATHGNAIDLGSLYGNGGPGIDLGGDGPTSNDTLDADAGPNGLQNYPTVASAVTNANDTVTVSGTFSGAPNASFTLRFHRADTGANPFQDGVSVTTDARGFAAFNAVLSFLAYPVHPPLPANISMPLVATATDADGNTSELSGLVVPAQPTALSLYTVAPCRFLDTREAEGPTGGPALINGRPRQVGIPWNCAVPGTARALVVNVTVTNPTASGHLRMAANPWATGTSIINFQAGQTRANPAVVTLDSGAFAALPILEGSLSGTVDLILDVSGYLE